MKYDPKRDLAPHKAAVVAMSLWGARYAKQRLGSMGFWDSLSESDKRLCRDIVARVELAPAEKDLAHV